MLALATAPLGVFDSGVGGLTVLSALKQALPGEHFIYLGDTARLPYGPKPQAMVRGFANDIAVELLERGVKGIVIACNTASAAALPELAERLPVPTWGVVEPGVDAALAKVLDVKGARVGVLGTVGTVEARVYQDRLELAGVATWSRACPLFVPIVEEGVSDTAIARLVARHYLSDRPELAAVILGCTHYPLLKQVLSEVLGDAVELIDSAVAVAAAVKRDLQRLGLTRKPGSEAEPGSAVHYLVTGDVTTFMHSAAVLGGPAGQAEHIDVTTLGRRKKTAAQ